MPQQHHSPMWLDTENGLAIKFGHHANTVPASLSTQPISAGGLGTTADPSTNLLTLESAIRPVPVPNGIAAVGDGTYWLTGKRWPHVLHVRLSVVPSITDSPVTRPTA